MYKFIKDRLKELGKTQVDLAECLHIHPAHLNTILAGKRSIQAREVAPMAKFLKLDAGKFVKYISGDVSLNELLSDTKQQQQEEDTIDDNLLLKIVNYINELEEKNGYEFSAADKKQLIKLVYLKLKELPENEVLDKTAEIVSIYDYMKKAN